jgi:hypothetical protein
MWCLAYLTSNLAWAIDLKLQPQRRKDCHPPHPSRSDFRDTTSDLDFAFDQFPQEFK